MNIPTVKLNNNLTIPQIGLGLWQVTNQEDFNKAFKSAYDEGYRMFDTAQFYRNEQYLGLAIQKYKINRSDLFITTKIAVNNFGFKKTIKSFKESLAKLNTDYIDLILLHFPVSVLRKKSYLALEEIYSKKEALSIGVSNYTIRHLEDLFKYAQIVPVINQVELHVFLQQPELIIYCKEHQIAVEAYSPLAHGLKMENDIITKLALKYHKTYAQIMLRFLVQLDLIVIPKSITPKRIKENFNIFDFKIDESDMDELKSLNKNLRTCWNPTLVP
jgi:diketogulonate reductase-like aldo/keto reductase